MDPIRELETLEANLIKQKQQHQQQQQKQMQIMRESMSPTLILQSLAQDTVEESNKIKKVILAHKE